jgi:hypothetical protein
MLLVKCWACGVAKEPTQMVGRISSGRRNGVPSGHCKPCRAADKRAKRRERPIETLSNKSLGKLGLPYVKSGPKAFQREIVEARSAWREWIKRRAPDEWVAAFYESSGMPWRNPRLSEAEAWKMRYRLDQTYRCAELLRMRVKKKMRRDGVSEAIRNAALGKAKSATLLQRLGYTPEQLKTHIERQFTKRMDWQAFGQGKIHIDHIRPLSAFDLSDEPQFREAFSLPNLRPLWAEQNIAKGARVEHLL